MKQLSVCLIHPKFEPSFWGYDFALPLNARRQAMLGHDRVLPALAALAPSHRTVELIDENVEALDLTPAAIARFEVIASPAWWSRACA